jgi:uncharacterized RDD family membrane protein YckC
VSDPGPEPQRFEQRSEEAADRPNDRPDLDPAPFGRRVLALLVDCALSVLAAGLFERPQLWSSLVLIVEYTFFTGFFSETPGMRLLGLRCVSLPDGGPLGVPRALLRAVLLSLVLPAVVTDARGRGYHDRAARSMVVRAKRVSGP